MSGLAKVILSRRESRYTKYYMSLAVSQSCCLRVVTAVVSY